MLVMDVIAPTSGYFISPDPAAYIRLGVFIGVPHKKLSETPQNSRDRLSRSPLRRFRKLVVFTHFEVVAPISDVL